MTTLDPGFNRFMNPWDYAGQNMLYGWAYPVPANMSGIPSRLHVVGNVVDRNAPEPDGAYWPAGQQHGHHRSRRHGSDDDDGSHPRLLERSPARATSRSCCPFRSPRAGSSSRSLCSTSKSRWRSSTRTSTGDRHPRRDMFKPEPGLSFANWVALKILRASGGGYRPWRTDFALQTRPVSSIVLGRWFLPRPTGYRCSATCATR